MKLLCRIFGHIWFVTAMRHEPLAGTKIMYGKPVEGFCERCGIRGCSTWTDFFNDFHSFIR